MKFAENFYLARSHAVSGYVGGNDGGSIQL